MLFQKPNATPQATPKTNATPKAKCYSKRQMLLQKPNATPKAKRYSKSQNPTSYSKRQMPFHKSVICF
jgi:hypothetical protein